ncbi:hypothetical protein RUM44_002301 [Polyplax serrata]|uniref:Uncharacterized protein n=1 Tax=Polyplax serrata TaxID=468196 RepID=A0ABR1AMU2_POLSC
MDFQGVTLDNLKTARVNLNRINSDLNEKINTSLKHRERVYAPIIGTILIFCFIALTFLIIRLRVFQRTRPPASPVAVLNSFQPSAPYFVASTTEERRTFLNNQDDRRPKVKIAAA